MSQSEKPAGGGGDAGQAEVQAKMDEETEQGFSGTKADPTPNENYTVAGVTAGAPTPETHAGQKAAAEAHQRQLSAPPEAPPPTEPAPKPAAKK